MSCWKEFSFIQGGIDVVPLLTSLQKQPELWAEYTFRQRFIGNTNRDTETVFLRYTKGRCLKDIYMEADEAADWPALEKLPEAQIILDQFRLLLEPQKIGRVFIVALKPGGKVLPHEDVGMYSDRFERFHIPLQSDDGNEFFCQHSEGVTESVFMRPGELWWFNHKKLHWVVNGSARDRLHLIVDAVCPQYRKER